MRTIGFLFFACVWLCAVIIMIVLILPWLIYFFEHFAPMKLMNHYFEWCKHIQKSL